LSGVLTLVRTVFDQPDTLDQRRTTPTGPPPATPARCCSTTAAADLSAPGAHDVIGAIADQAGIADDFTSHALRHTFGTTLVRDGHDLVLVAELMGHARLDQSRHYSLPTQADRERAINSLPTDR
jgi:integrase